MSSRDEERSEEQLRRHYEVETELAARLRNASTSERGTLYAALYDELYRRVPDHPQLTRKAGAEERREALLRQVALLRPLLRTNGTFLEIGPGDCALSFEVAKLVRDVYGVDVSDVITKSLSPPKNFHLTLSDGCSIPLPPGSIDVAYSNQLMEHLHPDDARAQIENIHRVLAQGGVYVCLTPNRLSGPHDVSRLFDQAARGFHLKEYTASELKRLFLDVGFSRVSIYCFVRERPVRLPSRFVALAETLLDASPWSLRRVLSDRLPFKALLNNLVLATK
ncbi:MAG: class I SAM-dependent methyltransferase [Deltaproteobacteria bacterium]|nr:class I SAM-dependent methyltransferase [Deltaproteobacteria bacterium]